MSTCPQFTKVSKDTQFITVDNVAELVPSTDERTAGTTVTVTCSSGLVLQGQSSFTCNNGKWSYDTKPACVVPGATTPAPAADTSKLVIGVVAGLGGLITLALIIMIIFIYRKDRQKRAEKRDLMENFDIHPRQDYSRSGPPTIEMSEGYPPRDTYYDRGTHTERTSLVGPSTCRPTLGTRVRDTRTTTPGPTSLRPTTTEASGPSTGGRLSWRNATGRADRTAIKAVGYRGIQTKTPRNTSIERMYMEAITPEGIHSCGEMADQFGRPVYLPPYSRDAGARYQDDYPRADYPPPDYDRSERPVDWRKAVLEDRDWPRRQDGHQGRWISRHSDRDSEEHFDRAHVHGGNNPGRDPFLWRNAKFISADVENQFMTLIRTVRPTFQASVSLVAILTVYLLWAWQTAVPTPAMSHNHMNHMNMTTAASSMMNHEHMNHKPGMHMDMNDTSGCDSMGMMMYFHEGNCEYVLFEGLHVTTAGGMVGACFAIFALGVLYEGLKVLWETLLQRAMVSKYASSANGSSQDAMVLSNKNVGIHMMSGSHFLQTLLHMIQVFISYCLMLIFMTYNAWLCLAVILGAGVGYFLFGWRKAIVVDINEHCH